MQLAFELVVILLLIGVNGLFSLSELALVSVNRAARFEIGAKQLLTAGDEPRLHRRGPCLVPHQADIARRGQKFS